MSFFEFPHTRTYDSDLGWLMSKYPEIAENAANAAASEEAAKASEEAAAKSMAQAASSATQAANSYSGMVEEVHDVTETLNARLSQAISGLTPTDSELQDIRVWYDSTVSLTAGDAVRGQARSNRIYTENLTEASKNLLNVDAHAYKTLNDSGSADVSELARHRFTVRVKTAGAYRYVYIPVVVTGINTLTVSASAVSGEGLLRIGVLAGTGITWLTQGSPLFASADVSGYTSVIVAIYATASTSAAVGTVASYTDLQIESGPIRTEYNYPLSPVDTYARRRIQQFFNDNGYRCGQVFPELTAGYVDYHTGRFSTYSPNDTYRRTGYVAIPDNTYVIDIPFSFQGDGGYAFYDENTNYIAGSTSLIDRFIIKDFITAIPSNAKYIALTSYNINAQHPSQPIRFYTHSTHTKQIACIGDSITEGMNMASQKYVWYGGDNYPSHLQTLLYDNGYDGFVKNYGNSGEKTAAILARVGGTGAAYLGTTITIPADNSPVDITNIIYSSYTDELITFTRIDYRAAIASVNGRIVRLQMSNNRLYMNLWESAGAAVQILANAPITIGKYFMDRNADVAISYIGINDTDSITFEEWINRNNIIRNIYGQNRTFVIGTTNAQWNIYPDIRDTANPVVTYNRRCAEEFGNWFINLYPIMCQTRGIDIAIAGGYLTNRTAEQIAADNAAIAAWKVPPSLTVDGTSGNVHFNDAGYYVMAKIIYDRMIDLNII